MSQELYKQQLSELLYSTNKLMDILDKTSLELTSKKDLFETGHIISYEEFDELLDIIDIVNIKMKEHSSTINYITDKIKYSETEVSNDVMHLKLRAEVIDSQIPNTAAALSDINIELQLKNVGLDAWDINKYLFVEITKKDIYYKDSYSLSISEGVTDTGDEVNVLVSVPSPQNKGLYKISIALKAGEYVTNNVLERDILII